MKMLRIAVILMVLWASAANAATPAEIAAQGKFDEAVAAFRKAIDAAPDPAEKGRLHKELGDLYAAREDNKKAAAEFVQALRLYRGFTKSERLRMAVRISWGGYHDAALQEFTAILLEDPGAMEARLGRARTLAWAGKYGEAIAEADWILQQDPGNRAALLVKANCLRWQGNPKAAHAIITKLLQEGEDFDTRLGLAYALLAKGDRHGARQSAALLAPKYPYQEKEVKSLNEELERATASALDLRYSYYNDTDDNTVNRVGLSYATMLARLGVGFDYRHTDAEDTALHNSADDFSVRFSTKLADLVEIGGGAGFTLIHPVATSDTTYFTGNARAVFDVLNGTAGTSFSRDIFTDTAQIIEHKIRIHNTAAFFSQRVADRLSLTGRYSYRDYSDDNSAHDVQLSPVYRVYAGNPAIGVGYRFRYLDFARQSGSGYFDPNDFISNGLFVSGYYERGGFYLYLEPYGGFQRFRRNGTGSNDLFGSVTGSVGYKIGKHFLCEVNGEFGNYAVQTATGFEYHLAGARLQMLF